MASKTRSASYREFLAENGGTVTEAKVREYLVGKALQDEEFRKSLVGDPNGTVAAEVGVTVPDSIKFHVHEESSEDLHLVLPAPVELTAQDMHRVAGGWGQGDGDIAFDDDHLVYDTPGQDDDDDG